MAEKHDQRSDEAPESRVSPEEVPGSERRDHTVPPTEIDPSEEELPEGPQPPKDVARKSWLAAGATIALIWLAAACVVAFLIPQQGVLFYIVYSVLVLLVAALPVLNSWRLRNKELKELNE